MVYLLLFRVNIKPPRHRFGFSLAWGWQYSVSFFLECETVSGPDPGVPCVFPFTYGGEVHKKCTELEHTGFWCATETDTDGNYVTDMWGDCDCPNCACSTEGNFDFDCPRTDLPL